MKKLVPTMLIFWLLPLTSHTPFFGSSIKINQMIEDWQRAKIYTQEYLDAMPAEDYGFKPTPEIRSFAQQYLHITAVNFRYIAAATGRKNPFPGDALEDKGKMQNKAAVTKVTMSSYDAVIDALNDLKASDMNEKAILYDLELTKEKIFRKGFEHQTHHRGQTTIYLRLKGIKPPSERLF